MTRRRSLLLAALAATVVAVPALPTSASAATYDVFSCRDLDDEPVATTAWRPGGHSVGGHSDTCAAGGTLSAWLTNAATWETAVSGYRFAVPPGLTVQQYFVWFVARTDGTPAGAYRAGVGQFGELSPAVVDHGCTGGSPALCSVGTPGAPQYVGDTMVWPQLSLLAICSDGSGGCAPAGAEPARIDLYRSIVRFDDGVLPTVGPIGGTIADGATVGGTRSVRAEAADVGSGVRRVELLVDGAVVDQQVGDGLCAEPYVVADPCPDRLRAAFDLDTTTLADGAHDAALRVTDAAGNVTTGPTRAFTVDNAPPPPNVIVVPGPAPEPPPAPPAPPAPPVIEPPEEPAPPAPASLRLRLPARVALPARDDVDGRVTDPDGTPKPGVAIAFERRPLGGGDDEWRAMRAKRTSGADGRFAFPVPGGSAEVRAVVAGATVSGRAVVPFVRELDVEARGSDQRLRNGDAFVLRGRFEHAGGALEDRSILVQARVRGDWRTVDSVEADAAGRVRWRYRFTNTTRTARYTFRLVLPRAKRLPWGRVASEPVSVLVRGG